MSEKKYIFKIDHSKAIEKFGRNLETHGREKITSSDFKVTCVNCLYYKEIEVDANYYPYRPMLFIPDLHFTIVKSESVIDIVKDEDGSVKIMRSNEYGDENVIAYFSDKDGNMTHDPQYFEKVIINIIKDFKDLYDAISNCGILLLENLTDTYIQNIIEYLTGNQLQALAEHLSDDQLQALVDHLTNHQLKTLAQELNETKLKVIVPILDENQLETLVKELKPGQLENVLPHLKMDQFKVLINSIDDPQLIDLTRNLSDHHLTILSKELWHERLQFLVHTLEGDKLKDLVNKLDHEKLEVIAQNLTDPGRIKLIIDSLTDSEKLQIFAHNISEQLFAELLNNLDTKELKDIIHKLPYEKVTTVIGQSGDKHQLDFIVRVLEEKFGDQFK
ncbi:hypothetical protein [Wolbachia endosymbiont of Cimex lectularius]|uniref:hypothetical protein n=1 Tax=Wolbachia endosymbiont of Cimex lectularius TaxID=246273 RepID=UPI00069384B6|nr:hypothetical protein [Wolbachia endosymbiont of Cimex lectularius]